MLSVFALFRRILKLGLKRWTFSKSEFPGLLENILTFDHRWLKAQVISKHIQLLTHSADSKLFAFMFCSVI